VDKFYTESAVLFITFARPEYAEQSFNAICMAKPRYLYFYNNAPREGNEDEYSKCMYIRSFINRINWDCKLKTYFRDVHVDIYTSLFSAIDWVFQKEEQAIILEEDCVASLAFFDYCRQLLPLYKDDIRIWLLSGDNYFPHYNPSGYDYIFSRYPYQYGWASWKSRWDKVIRINIPWVEMKEYKLYEQIFPNPKEAKARILADDRAYKTIQTKPAWDYIFGFTVKSQGGFGIVPTNNLVSNIGVSGHHNNRFNSLVNCRKILTVPNYPIQKHPPFVVPDYRYDRYFHKHFYPRKLDRLVNKGKKLLNIRK